MTEPTQHSLVGSGLWHNNAALVQLLGLCPLLAISTSVVNALALGVTTLLVLLVSNTLVALLRTWITPEVRLPVFALIIGTAVGIAELLLQAFAFRSFVALGIFLPLIGANCLIVARADQFAVHNTLPRSIGDALTTGGGYLAVIVLMGVLRELFGNGTLFADMDALFGPVAANWTLYPFESRPPLRLMLLPPGAFLLLGMLVALKNLIDSRAAAASPNNANAPAAGSLRVRISGRVR